MQTSSAPGPTRLQTFPKWIGGRFDPVWLLVRASRSCFVVPELPLAEPNTLQYQVERFGDNWPASVRQRVCVWCRGVGRGSLIQRGSGRVRKHGWEWRTLRRIGLALPIPPVAFLCQLCRNFEAERASIVRPAGCYTSLLKEVRMARKAATTRREWYGD